MQAQLQRLYRSGPEDSGPEDDGEDRKSHISDGSHIDEELDRLLQLTCSWPPSSSSDSNREDQKTLIFTGIQVDEELRRVLQLKCYAPPVSCSDSDEEDAEDENEKRPFDNPYHWWPLAEEPIVVSGGGQELPSVYTHEELDSSDRDDKERHLIDAADDEEWHMVDGEDLDYCVDHGEDDGDDDTPDGRDHWRGEVIEPEPGVYRVQLTRVCRP